MINEVVIGVPKQIQSNPLVVICSEDILPLRSLPQYKYPHLLSRRGINSFPPSALERGGWRPSEYLHMLPTHELILDPSPLLQWFFVFFYIPCAF